MMSKKPIWHISRCENLLQNRVALGIVQSAQGHLQDFAARLQYRKRFLNKGRGSKLPIVFAMKYIVGTHRPIRDVYCRNLPRAGFRGQPPKGVLPIFFYQGDIPHAITILYDDEFLYRKGIIL
jgi:hypothetical protein